MKKHTTIVRITLDMDAIARDGLVPANISFALFEALVLEAVRVDTRHADVEAYATTDAGSNIELPTRRMRGRPRLRSVS